MAHVERRGQGRWRARYRAADGREISRTFTRRVDAERFVTSKQGELARGEWVDPARGRITVGAWSAAWLERVSLRLKATTVADYESLIRTCVLPDWERVPINAVTFAEVDAWVAGLSRRGLGASRVRKAHRVLSLMMTAAIKDARLSRNPCTGVTLPRLQAKEPRFLTAESVRALAAAVGDHYAPLVYVLATCGLRWGEATALQVADVDLMRRRVRVSQSVSEVNGVLVWSTTKTHQARSVALPGFVADMLTVHLAGLPADALCFTSPDGAVLRNQNFRHRVWDRAVREAGLHTLTPHDLRHTAASLAIDSGATVLAVSRMLGHSSPVLTLTTYSHLFDATIDELADRMNGAFLDLPAACARPDAASGVVDIRSATDKKAL